MADAGLLRLQQAAWQPAGPYPPLLGENVSPSLQQAALLVRKDRPTLQVRNLVAGDIPILMPLPDGSKPLSTPTWHPSGEHIALLYETPSSEGSQLSVFVLRLSDQATQRAQLETLPANTKLSSSNLPLAWAPNSATLLVVHGQDDKQVQACFRRSRLKAVGCELVYHSAQSCQIGGMPVSLLPAAARTWAASKESAANVPDGLVLSAGTHCGIGVIQEQASMLPGSSCTVKGVLQVSQEV